MFRSFITLVAVVAGLGLLPQQASANLFGSQVVCYYAVHQYSVFPAHGHGARRLPGQWWNQHQQYPWSPPANHAYGHIDHGDKAWSVIPGDGYVGAPDKEDLEEDSEDETTPDDLDDVDIEKLLEGDSDQPMLEPEPEPEPPTQSLPMPRPTGDRGDEPKDDLNASTDRLPPPDVEETDPTLIQPSVGFSSGAVDFKLVAPKPDQSSMGTPLLVLGVLGFGLGGHSARRLIIRDARRFEEGTEANH